MTSFNTEFSENEYFKTPDHLVIWLDRYIGCPGKYYHLKRAFASNTDPKSQVVTSLSEPDFDNLLRSHDTVPVYFDTHWLLLTVDDLEVCLQCFEANQGKRIFFIISGSMAWEAVPRIIDRCQEGFTDSSKNKLYPSIYVLNDCCIGLYEWAMDYSDYILIFDHEADLLARLTRDIAAYYVEQGKHILQLNCAKDALVPLCWARRLLARPIVMDGDRSTKMINTAEELITKANNMEKTPVLIETNDDDFIID